MNLATHITTKEPVEAKKTNGQLNRKGDENFIATALWTVVGLDNG